MQDEPFRRSSYCTDAHGCVEVSMGADAVRVRDGKVDDSPVLAFSREDWAAFVETVKAGRWDG
jgi:hypothetical protein